MGHRPSVLRITPDDDLFVRMHRAAGLGVVSQMLWRLRSPLEAGELEQFGTALAAGHFNRVLRRRRLPLARDHWIRGGTPGAVHIDSAALTDDQIHDWIDTAAQFEVDLTAGPVWELRSVALLDGGELVSLCFSHAVADGALFGKNIDSALSAEHPAIPPATPVRARDDLSDALGQLRQICGGLGTLAASWIRSRRSADERPADVVTSMSVPFPDHIEVPDDAPGYVTPFAVASVPTKEWLDVAARHGGTGNSLFVAMVVGILVGTGRACWDDTVRVSVPMTARTDPDDIRSNATTGRSLDLPARLSQARDLAAVKAHSKLMYVDSARRPSTVTLLQPLAQALSDRTLLRLNRRAATPLALASNMGTFSALFGGLGREDRVDKFMVRSVTPAVTRERLIQLRGGLMTCVIECGDTTNLTVSGLDPVALPDTDTLSELLASECARWNLKPTLW